MSKNKDLHAAKRAKNDEFYTQLPEIENELRHYKGHFEGKSVYCNCDDPRVSNFVRYFAMNFAHLGLRRLTATCYKNQDADLFSRHDQERALKLEYQGHRQGERDYRSEDIAETPLEGDGDFRSAECIELLDEADIVVTNPPFSLFREYIAQLMAHNKKFIVIGSMNAVTYKEIFPLIKDNLLWYGPSISSGDREFGVPDHYPLNASGCRTDDQGNKFIRVKGVRWFTNLDHAKRHEELPLWRTYNPTECLHYDNYDAINVNKVADIPVDWYGAMGVPISFLDKHNPDQFEVLGITDRDNNSGLKTKVYSAGQVEKPGDLNRRGVVLVNGVHKPTYVRIFIRNRTIQA